MHEATMKDILEKAYEKLLPAAGYLISNTAGFAASLIVFSTWLLKKSKSAKEKTRIALERDQARLIELNQIIREEQEKLKRLERLYENTGDPWEKKRLERSIRLLRENIEKLMQEYELVELRIMAVKKLRMMGATHILKDAYKLAEKIEEGKLEETQYKILKTLEEEWRRRQLTLEGLKRIIEEG